MTHDDAVLIIEALDIIAVTLMVIAGILMVIAWTRK